MKTTARKLMSFAVIGLAAGTLAACETGLGDYQDAPPYSQSRTATHDGMVKPAEPMPEPAPMPVCPPVPECPACADTSSLEGRIATLEAELAACREASTRVRDAMQTELKK